MALIGRESDTQTNLGRDLPPGAAFHKLLHGHFTLRWALSDNLRHQLLVHYDLAGLPRTPVADWLLDDVWRFRTAALLNLISQASPILADTRKRFPGFGIHGLRHYLTIFEAPAYPAAARFEPHRSR